MSELADKLNATRKSTEKLVENLNASGAKKRSESTAIVVSDEPGYAVVMQFNGRPYFARKDGVVAVFDRKKSAHAFRGNGGGRVVRVRCLVEEVAPAPPPAETNPHE